MASATTFDELFGRARRSAVHLEMRDGYMLDDPAFVVWKTDGSLVLDDSESVHWRALVGSAVSRGVEVRRARIVSEPVSAYIRFEYETTSPHNVAAGELVRWLPRRQATDLALPGNDFWLFDGTTALINHFSGYGDWIDTEITSEPGIVKLCEDAFDAVWTRAVEHKDYRPV